MADDECVVCGEELYPDQEWRLRPDIEPDKLETEYDEEYVKPYCHEACFKYFRQLEKVAEKEHQQWSSWINYCIENYDIPEGLVEKWESKDVPYSELPDVEKEKDRKWARKILNLVRKKEFGGDLE